MQATKQENILAIYKTNKDLIWRINDDLLKINKEKRNNFKEPSTEDLNECPWIS